jgi:hypothetical protein
MSNRSLKVASLFISLLASANYAALSQAAESSCTTRMLFIDNSYT